MLILRLIWGFFELFCIFMCFLSYGKNFLHKTTDGGADLEAAFYILRHTACAACLTENGFMDCADSLDFLLSDEGKAAMFAGHSPYTVRPLKARRSAGAYFVR